MISTRPLPGRAALPPAVTIVRVIRNLGGRTFAWRADAAGLRDTADRCRAALRTAGWRLVSDPPAAAAAARVRCLLPARTGESPAVQLLRSPGPGRPPRLAVLLNGIDHLVLQFTRPGLCAGPAIRDALRRTGALDRRLGFVHAPRWGWLAASPADCGAGVRILWLIPAPGPARVREGLEAAGLAASAAAGGRWLVTHRRPLGRAPAGMLRRYEQALGAR